MSTAVFSLNKRFKLVEKLTGDVGDGTEFPMLVSPVQLAELNYRVRDAVWVSGNAGRTVINLDENPVFNSDVTFNGVSPGYKVEWETRNSAFDAAYTRRGYVAVTNDATPDEPMDGYGPTVFSAVSYLTVGGLLGSHPTYDLAWREADVERGIWASLDAREPKYNAGEIIDGAAYLEATPNDTFKTGFSFFGTSWTDSLTASTIYGPVGYVDGVPTMRGTVQIIFTGEVAWVDDDGSRNPFSAGNRLYVGMKFGIIDPFEDEIDRTLSSLGWSFSTFTGDLHNPASTAASLKLKLSGAGNYLTAPIFVSEGDYSIVPGYRFEVYSITDWEFEATEWWP